MTTTATRASSPASSRSAVGPLAVLEARRFARHPLFLVGVALLVLSTAPELFADPVNVGLMGQPIVPAMTLGVFGLVVAARLTRSSQRSLETLGAHPVPERSRSHSRPDSRSPTPRRRVLPSTSASWMPLGDEFASRTWS